MKMNKLYPKALFKIIFFTFLVGVLIEFSSCKKDDDNPLFTLTVNNGTGGGQYERGTVVNIAANSPSAEEEFDQWTGDTDAVADVNNPSTTVTMPGENITVTATYVDVTYTLTVENGSGSGEYTAGSTVNIEAEDAPAGQIFDVWTGDTEFLADETAGSTSVTIPSQAVTVTATYIDVYELTVTNGTGSGEYEEGEVITITADVPPAGQYFDVWTGDTQYLDDPAKAETTVEMPATEVEVTATYSDIPPASVMAGTWMIENYYELEGESWVLKNSDANDEFSLTLTFDDKFMPHTYEMVLGSVLAVPNYNNDENNSGNWSLDDLTDPEVITWDTDGESTMNYIVGSPTESSLEIWWEEDFGIENKPVRSIRLELIPVE